nr:hypothetical protein [Tanacetum cinerariifolium]
MVGGNGENQFRQYAGQNARNPTGYNDVIGNQVNQNDVQNPRVQNIGNQNGLIGVQGNGNQNQIRNGNLVAARAEGNASGQNRNQIRCYNCRGKRRVRFWVELVLPLKVIDDQLGKPDTRDHNKSSLLFPMSTLCQIPFVFNECMDGLGEFFLDPFSIINMGSSDNAPKNL